MSSNGGGPCGACKFLRRKCLKGCIFAPYFDSDQGTAHFAAVHKVFGASNASKLLLRIPAHKRLDAVVTLCYEALARVRDPVYGCVGHLFALQQQVVNLQAELAYIQARLSTLQHLPLPHQSPSQTTSTMASNSNMSMNYDQQQVLQSQYLSTELASICNKNPLDPELQADDLQSLARDFVSKYLPGVRFKPPSSHQSNF
ncbi:LOB domain-containing protein 19 [Jatropha curcas]|uniref:LOB domain-containing protein 19 n=1 Tax=Jatropha curcas TaxID=180498 RepID=UPI0005FB2867|nr:LOB domain-containing protein 19 [Jatropha curcas]